MGTGEIEPRRAKPSEEIRAEKERERRRESQDHDYNLARLKAGVVKFTVASVVVGLVLVMGVMAGISYILAGTTTILGISINIALTVSIALALTATVAGAGWATTAKGQKEAERRNRELVDENEDLRDQVEALSRKVEELQPDQPTLAVEEEGQ